MGLMSGFAQGYLQQMPIIDARHQREIENQRADEKQEAWRKQQARQQAIYEDALKEKAANRMLMADPTKYRDILGLEGPMSPETEGWLQKVQGGADPQFLATMAAYQSPDEEYARDLAKDLAVAQAKSLGGKPMPTFSANGRRFQPTPIGGGKWKNIDVGEDTKKSLVDMGGESEFTKRMGAYGVEDLKTLKDRADRARALKSSLRYIINSKSKAGGPGASFLLGAKQVLNKLGVPVKGLSEDEVLNAIGNQLAIAARGGAFSGGKPLPGAASDKDIQLLLESVPSLRQSPEGRILLAKMLDKIAAYDINKYSQAQESYVKEGVFDPVKFDYGFRYDDKETLAELAQQAKEIADRTKAITSPVNSGGKTPYIDYLVSGSTGQTQPPASASAQGIGGGWTPEKKARFDRIKAKYPNISWE